MVDRDKRVAGPAAGTLRADGTGVSAPPVRIALTGGGTGGHIYPALAIGEAARRRLGAADLLFIGARGGMEARIVPEHGVRFVGLPVRGLVRKAPLEVVGALGSLGQSTAQAVALVRRFRPHIVVATGGYAGGPVGLAAVLLRVPLLLQEQNAIPGVTNRFLARFAAAVAVPFAETAHYLPAGCPVLVVGNPVRPEIRGVAREAARRRMGLPAAGSVVLCVAGSRGSAVFVRLLREWLPHLQAGTLVFVSGEAHRAAAEAVLVGYRPPSGAAVVCLPYVERMGDALAAADLVVCRAGGMLWELAAVGRPAVLVPSPHVTHHHQEANALVWSRAGAGVVLPEAEVDGRRLAETVQELLAHPERLRAMGAAASTLGAGDALGTIVGRLVAIVEAGAAGRRPGPAPGPGPRRGAGGGSGRSVAAP